MTKSKFRATLQKLARRTHRAAEVKNTIPGPEDDHLPTTWHYYLRISSMVTHLEFDSRQLDSLLADNGSVLEDFLRGAINDARDDALLAKIPFDLEGFVDGN